MDKEQTHCKSRHNKESCYCHYSYHHFRVARSSLTCPDEKMKRPSIFKPVLQENTNLIVPRLLTHWCALKFIFALLFLFSINLYLPTALHFANKKKEFYMSLTRHYIKIQFSHFWFYIMPWPWIIKLHYLSFLIRAKNCCTWQCYCTAELISE